MLGQKLRQGVQRQEKPDPEPTKATESDCQSNATTGRPSNIAQVPLSTRTPFLASIGGQTTQVNPAIAYAVQQRGVDNKVLARPSIFDPVKQVGYSAFND